MVLTAPRPATRPVAHPAAKGRARRVERAWRPLTVATAITGAALTTIVGRSGSPVWQSVRLFGGLALTLLAVAAIDRWPDRRRGALAFLLGIAGTLAGIGIGVPHLAKGGLSVATVAGLAAGAAGLVLLAGGAALLLRRTSRRRRLAVSAALLLSALLSWFVLAPSLLATNVPSTELGARTPEDVGLAYRDVSYRSPEGETLSAWYVPSRNGAAVVLRHGSGSTRSNVLDHAAVLAGAGYGVLLSDARGHGRSGGQAMDFGWHGDDDVAAAVGFLRRQPDVDDGRIGAVGMSMGGEESLGALGAGLGLRAVVAEGATARTGDDLTWLSDAYGARGALQERLSWLTYAAADLLSEARRPPPLREAVATGGRPVLLIAAGDVADEGRAAHDIEAAAPDTVHVWVVPGAGHTDGLRTAAAAWEERVTSFLDAALAPGT
jgi:dienelactone hydrolase